MERLGIRRWRLVTAALAIVMVLALTGGQLAAAQSGADMAIKISGKKAVAIGSNITYTLTATNVGDDAATDVEVDGWVPDWFDPVSIDCLGGGPANSIYGCFYGSVAPGSTVKMTITVKAVAPEPTMYELAWVYSSNDVNTTNDQSSIKVTMTQCGGCSRR